MSQIADFTDSELWIIKTTLEERYGEPVEPVLADTELRLNPYSTELSLCPAACWEKGGCHFVVCKTGVQNYRCQFFYRGHEMYGTGIEEFDDLSECTVTLLQVQTDHATTRKEGDRGTG
ncbi:MAG: hypothetical protein U9P11_06680 [Pseudomonadota bacterium]|nr:hypothetical protein [Pseudomonadota bacterium]